VKAEKSNGVDLEISGAYEIPTFDDEKEPETPGTIKTFLAQVNATKYANATAMSMSDFQTLAKDNFRAASQLLKGIQTKTLSVEFIIYSLDLFIVGMPRITLFAGETNPEFCVGNNAITLRVSARFEKALIPFRNGLLDYTYFANFDGKLFEEKTQWVLNPIAWTDFLTYSWSVTMRLPRSAISTLGFTKFGLQSGSTVYFRATPAIFPKPVFSMFAKARLEDLYPQLESF
jgi:hypothetical protein